MRRPPAACWQPLQATGYYGRAYLTQTPPAIGIDQDLPLDADHTLHVMLHECAHWRNLRVAKAWERANPLKAMAGENIVSEDLYERATDVIADRYLTWADATCKAHGWPLTTFNRLLAFATLPYTGR